MKIKKSFKKRRDYGFWNQDIRPGRLSRLGDPLEKLDKGVDFEMFRILLEDGLIQEASGKGGRPAYDYVMMFRIMIFWRYYSLSDARRVKKNNAGYFGCKNRVRQDAESKPAVKYTVTDASVHDSRTTEELPDDKDKGGDLYVDSACSGAPQEKIISDREMNHQVHEKGSRNHPLTDELKERNGQNPEYVRVWNIFSALWKTQ